MTGELDLLLMATNAGMLAQPAVPVAVLAGYLLMSRRLERALLPIRAAVVEMQTTISAAGVPVQYLLTEARTSPVQPSEFGRKLVRESGLGDILDRCEGALLRHVAADLRRRRSRTAYDVQQAARTVLRRQRDRSCMAPVKDYAYREGIDLELVLRTGALVLRDAYLRRRST